MLKFSIYLMVVILIVTNAASSVTIVENIVVSGKGEINAKTNTAEGTDYVSGLSGDGGQQYMRHVVDNSDNSVFISHYNLHGDDTAYNKTSTVNLTQANGSVLLNIPRGDNRYYIKMSGIGGLNHYVDVSSLNNSDINTTNIISKSPENLTTRYDVLAEDARLTEAIYYYNSSTHPKYLAETKVSGDLKLSSTVTSNDTHNDDIYNQITKLELVKLPGEVAVQNIPVRTTKFTYGDFSWATKEGTYDARLTYSNGSTSNLIIKGDFNESNKSVTQSTMEVYKDYAIIWPDDTTTNPEEIKPSDTIADPQDTKIVVQNTVDDSYSFVYPNESSCSNTSDNNTSPDSIQPIQPASFSTDNLANLQNASPGAIGQFEIVKDFVIIRPSDTTQTPDEKHREFLKLGQTNLLRQRKAFVGSKVRTDGYFTENVSPAGTISSSLNNIF